MVSTCALKMDKPVLVFFPKIRGDLIKDAVDGLGKKEVTVSYAATPHNGIGVTLPQSYVYKIMFDLVRNYNCCKGHRNRTTPFGRWLFSVLGLPLSWIPKFIS